MPYTDYKKALTLGKKEYRACTAKGVSPYPAVLDQLLEGVRTCGEVDLGVVDVPVELIVGTRSAGRSNSFSPSFYPLMGEDTEFAGKWVALCQAHLNEGINEPIRAYEYMHNFYVLEGHKRVSVLRYFGAVTIPAHVTRILPARTKDLENIIYYEYLDFYQLTGINYLWFGKVSRYALLQTTVGKRPGEVWSAEERKDFFSFYLRFSAAFKAKMEKQLPSLPTGDAMLATMDFFGYDEIKDCTENELKVKLSKIKETLAAADGCPQEPLAGWVRRWMQPIKAVTEPIKAVTEAVTEVVTEPLKAVSEAVSEAVNEAVSEPVTDEAAPTHPVFAPHKAKPSGTAPQSTAGNTPEVKENHEDPSPR
jgi:hypothetical protein